METTPVNLTRGELTLLIQVLHPRMLELARAQPEGNTVTVLPETTLLTKLHEARDRFSRTARSTPNSRKASEDHD